MHNGKQTLTRLAKLYGLVEVAKSAEMRLAAALVSEAEQAMATQDTSIWMANTAGRSALEQFDPLGWKQAETGALLAGSTRAKLDEIRNERAESHAIASAEYQTSRLQSEQMSRLLEGTLLAAQTRELRQQQATADDRYLSRRRWQTRVQKTVDKTRRNHKVGLI